MEEAFKPHAELNQTQRRLIGAYFLHEYSFEASALFNPSIVRHPDQAGAPEAVGKQLLQKWELTKQRRQQQDAAVAILNACDRY
jgi:hypothetical protein